MSKEDPCGCLTDACVIKKDGDITRRRCQCEFEETGKIFFFHFLCCSTNNKCFSVIHALIKIRQLYCFQPM